MKQKKGAGTASTVSLLVTFGTIVDFVNAAVGRGPGTRKAKAGRAGDVGAQRGLTGGACRSDFFGTWKRVRVVLEQLVLARLQQRVPATVRVVGSASMESVAAWLVGLQA